jgi:predicted permease
MIRWWRRIAGRERSDRGLAQEIEAHIAERIDDLVDGGMAPDDARRVALREFGNPVRCLEDSRAVWSGAWLASFGQDVRYVLRTIRRQPLFSATVVFILTFGIGLVTALFTVVNARVLRPWPVPDPSSLVIIKPLPASDEQYGTLSSLEYRYFREHSRSFVDIAARLPGGTPIGRPDGTVVATVQSEFVTANYFDALRVGMTIGRGFLAEEEDYRTPRSVAIITERVWRQHFGSDPGLLGSPIKVGNELMTVVGVTERGFVGIRGSMRVDIYFPLPTVAIAMDRSFSARYLQSFNDPRRTPAMVFGRLRPRVTPDEGRAELEVLSRQFRTALGMEAPGLTVADTRPLSANLENARGQLGPQSLMLGGLLLVMLLACANAGNLVLAKTVARGDEIAIRLSLGASRARVARQLMTEMLVLSLAAGAAALYLAATVPSLMIRLLGSEIRSDEHLGPDAVVFLFTLLLSMIACVVASLGPVLQTTRAAVLGEGKDRVLANPSSPLLRKSLLATQIALSTVLLVSAGLLTRAISHAMSLDPGFAVADIREVSIVLPRGASADALPRIRETLTSAGLPPMAFSNLTPVTTARMEIAVRLPDKPAQKNRRLTLRPVSANYFTVLGIPVLSGRPFDERRGGREIVVSQSAARLLWRAGNPIGKRIVTGASDTAAESHDIVGVVADVPTTTLNEVEPVIYQPVGAAPVVLVRDLSPAVSARVKELVQLTVPAASSVSRPLVDALHDSLSSVIIGSRIAWGLGWIALLLAMLGAFGVFASMVDERRREIGVRMALGAGRSQVVQLVLRSATGPVMAGLSAGLVLSLVITPVLRRALYGMSPFDPIAYLGIAGILLASALAATLIPAVRAARVEPAVTLRGD